MKLEDAGKLVASLSKQLQALVSGALPWTASEFNLLPFLNPVIAKEQWPISAILALVASMVTYNLAKKFQKPRLARVLAVVGLVTALLARLSMNAVVGGLFLSSAPEAQDVFVRWLFVLLFVGLGSSLGYGFTHIL